MSDDAQELKQSVCEEQKSECACSCRKQDYERYAGKNPDWIVGSVKTSSGEIPVVSAKLSSADHIGSFKARLGVGRMHYSIEPGLYAVGTPDSNSPVLVSANYKMSFDRLRSQLSGRNAWIVVLDTKGINVWCAAGKGTFGTDEIVRRVNDCRLTEIVSHHTLVVPQLGAPGVSAHEVKRRCGFRVVYGPVRAVDLCAFLDAGMKATPEMRRVHFGIRDRMVLVPVEFIFGWKYAAIATGVFLLLSGIGRDGYSPGRVAGVGVVSAALCIGAYLCGTVALPALLPWLPGRAFAVKGAFAGLAFAVIAELIALAHPGLLGSGPSAAAWFFIAPAIASFVGMNFTGTSTYTSLSGVMREMRIAMPVQGICAGAGLVLWIVGRFV